MNAVDITIATLNIRGLNNTMIAEVNLSMFVVYRLCC